MLRAAGLHSIGEDDRGTSRGYVLLMPLSHSQSRSLSRAALFQRQSKAATTRHDSMCRERMISFLRPSPAHGASDERTCDQADAREPDVADVVRANLQRLRKARGLSLRGLAALADADPAELENLAAGRSFPGVGLLLKLARALDLPCTVFIEAPAAVSRAEPRAAPRVARASYR